MSMDNIVYLAGRFANQLWEISAATKLFGFGNFKVNLKFCGEWEKRAFENFQGIEVKENIEDSDRCMPLGYYQHKKWLVDPHTMMKYLKKPENIPHLHAVIHLRLDDYLQNAEYSPFVVSRKYITDACEKLNIDIKDCMVVSDTPSAVKQIYGNDLNVYDEPDTLRAFWTMVNSDYFIGSASTFSYWAAYLGKHKDFALPVFWHFPKDGLDTSVALCNKDLFWWEN